MIKPYFIKYRMDTENQEYADINQTKEIFESFLQRNPTIGQIFRLIYLFTKSRFLTNFNFNLGFIIPRLFILFLAFFQNNDFILIIAFSRTIQNVFLDLSISSGSEILTKKIKKALKNGEKEKIPKYLLYSIIMTILYGLFIFVPLTILICQILIQFSTFSPKIAFSIKNVTFINFLPGLLMSINAQLIAYFQAFKLNSNIGLVNLFASTCACTITLLYFFKTYEGLRTFHLISWSTPCFQFIIFIYFYFIAFNKKFWIKNLKIVFKDFSIFFKAFFKKALNNIIMNIDFVVISFTAAVILPQNFNGAFNFILSNFLLFFKINSIHPKLPYFCLKDYIYDKKPNMAKMACLISSGVLLFIILIMDFWFLLFLNFLIIYTMPASSQIYKHIYPIFWVAGVGQIWRTHVYFMIDSFRILEKNKLNIFLKILKNFLILMLILPVGIKFNYSGVNIWISFLLANLAMDIFYHGVLWFENWENLVQDVDNIKFEDNGNFN